ncbi:MAG: hypothetical protein Harvfovirus38_3 [Harvfovirus sp.]|uniref:Uncharacterized protein n=1 Tax=Harvfovirus sp. TaxID=2487768 RepID=A0A3G5A7T4_9VIRU|nr:MAG: hypothetical protein Harvfovirus38_3 [Harvfovirus sp.]
MTEPNCNPNFVPNLFAYQTQPQYIECAPTAFRMDIVDATNEFKVIDNQSIKLRKSGRLLIFFNITFSFPQAADTIKYWATLNGKIINGSGGQTDTAANFSGVATRAEVAATNVVKGDILQFYGISSTGLDETFIVKIPEINDKNANDCTTPRNSGGFSVLLELINSY